MKTSEHLVKCCLIDELPEEMPTLADYFKYALSNEENFIILFGVYQGLVKYKDVECELLHKCCVGNRLGELIDKKYKHRSSYYYKLYKENKIKVDDKNGAKDMSFKIYDDDYCPKCNSKGFITNNNSLDIDCPICFKFICKKCSSLDDEEPIHLLCKKL